MKRLEEDDVGSEKNSVGSGENGVDGLTKACVVFGAVVGVLYLGLLSVGGGVADRKL